MSRNALAISASLLASVTIAGCGGGSSPFSKASSNELIFISAAQTWDVNKDNSVTCDEWVQYTTELFHAADQDGDGIVTAEEYKKIVSQDRLFETITMAHFDGNKDGKLTLQEFTGARNPAFEMLDRDKDCQIASAEMVQTRQLQQFKDKSSAPNVQTGPGPR
jgi:Ca2+-binding EF-hand superfamily protein